MGKIIDINHLLVHVGSNSTNPGPAATIIAMPMEKPEKKDITTLADLLGVLEEISSKLDQLPNQVADAVLKALDDRGK